MKRKYNGRQKNIVYRDRLKSFQHLMHFCSSCEASFVDAHLQRSHFTTEWHRYNLKRRMAELPAISLPLFETKFLQFKSLQKPIENLEYCGFCHRQFSSKNAYKSHLTSKKHIANQENFVEVKEEAVVGGGGGGNVEHGNDEYIVELDGGELINNYLVHVEKLCLSCLKFFDDKASAQKHMGDKQHYSINKKYAFKRNEQDHPTCLINEALAGKEGGEDDDEVCYLVLKSGAIAWHRSFLRYLKQRIDNPAPSSRLLEFKKGLDLKTRQILCKTPNHSYDAWMSPLWNRTKDLVASKQNPNKQYQDYIKYYKPADRLAVSVKQNKLFKSRLQVLYAG